VIAPMICGAAIGSSSQIAATAIATIGVKLL
jgi:hypothetical protein